MQQPYKVCPRCKTSAALDAQICVACGHVYRTQFVPPDRTQMFMPGQLPPPPSATGPEFSQPPNYGSPMLSASDLNQKKIVAGILALTLGGLGIHSFYLGNTSQGVMLLGLTFGGIFLSFLTCGMLFFVPGVAAILAIVQGIKYLTSTDQQFYQLYMVERRWF